MLMSIVLIPTGLGALALFISSRRLRRAILLIGSGSHATAVCILAINQPAIKSGGWVGLDALGLLFLAITSILFAAVAVYTCGYLTREAGHVVRDVEEGFSFGNKSEAVFIGCLLFFLAAMSLVCISRDLGLLWVAVEATTLVSAPLISFHRHHRSLEATWKYLLICSVGIALALLGNYFFAYAGHGRVHLNIDALVSGAATLDPLWLKAGFLMLLVGYGTKMGLAPMHTWLPDAHSEAPSMVSALLSGALLNCAFLGILRGNSVLNAAGLGRFSGELLVFFGLLSVSLAAVFTIRQADYKRMLAYSSIEHMGILSVGMGIGGLAGTGAMLHSIGHSLTKAMLFLCAGQLLYVFRTKTAGDVRHVLQDLPLTGFLWMAGFLSITGSPPFSLFISEVTILKGALDNGRWAVAAGYLAALGIIFIAMARIVLSMVFGRSERPASPDDTAFPHREELWFAIPAIALGAVPLIFGLYVPSVLWDFLSRAASVAGGH
ncbi:MAG: proton-conducting transporter membrane subunit [Desulfobacterales bacterium]|nr:proton-conducting transporter membrane subunit [Desulfobacterales bacterium]